MQASEDVVVRHRVPGFSEAWVIVEEKVPEAPIHDACLELFKLLLVAMIVRTGRDARVYRNLAIRVNREKPNLGFDPDISMLEPAPREGEDLDSLRLWLPGNPPPSLALEVVSKNHPHKDYSESPDKCAASGVGELIVFDPQRVGARAHGKRALIQVWQRAADGGFDRVYFGAGPAHCKTLDAWMVATDERRRLRIAEDREGKRLWPTPEETERVRANEALARVAALEAELARRR